MTRDEILSMEAGRELDALVATEVMGWAKCVPGTGWLLDEEWKKLGEGEVFWYNSLGLISAANKNGYRMWRPSYDIAAAMQVLDTFDRREWDIAITSYTEDEGEIWGCELHHYSEKEHLGWYAASDASLPKAISITALLAKMQP